MSEPTVALALWGISGAGFYAASRLITALLGDQEIDRRGKQRAWALCVLSVLFGPAAAVAFTPVVMARVGQGATVPAVAFTIGLLINAAYPAISTAVGPQVRRAFGGWLGTIAASLTSGDKA